MRCAAGRRATRPGDGSAAPRSCSAAPRARSRRRCCATGPAPSRLRDARWASSAAARSSERARRARRRADAGAVAARSRRAAAQRAPKRCSRTPATARGRACCCRRRSPWPATPASARQRGAEGARRPSCRPGSRPCRRRFARLVGARPDLGPARPAAALAARRSRVALRARRPDRRRSTACAPASASRAAAAPVDFIDASVIDSRLRDIEAQRRQLLADKARRRAEPPPGAALSTRQARARVARPSWRRRAPPSPSLRMPLVDSPDRIGSRDEAFDRWASPSRLAACSHRAAQRRRHRRRQPAGRGGAGPPGHASASREAVVAVRRPAPARPVRPSPAAAPPPPAPGAGPSDRVWLYDFREPLGPGTRCTVSCARLEAGTDGRRGSRRQRRAVDRPDRVQLHDRRPGDRLDAAVRRQRDRGRPALPAAPERRRPSRPASRPTPGARSKGIGERMALVRRRRRRCARSAAEGAAASTKAAARAPLLVALPAAAAAARRRAPRLGQGHRRRARTRRCSTTVEQRFRYTVRPAFTAEFSCEREKRERALPADPADDACASRRRSRASWRPQVRLSPAAGDAARAGVRQGRQGDRGRASVTFPTPLAENAAFTRRAAARPEGQRRPRRCQRRRASR